MKAITAAVIAILNVNIRFRLPARCSSGAKKDRGATAEGPLVADRLWDSQRREGQLRAVRSAFEPADFGQIAALKTGLETELRDIRTKFAEGDRVLAMQFWQKTPATTVDMLVVTLVRLRPRKERERANQEFRIDVRLGGRVKLRRDGIAQPSLFCPHRRARQHYPRLGSSACCPTGSDAARPATRGGARHHLVHPRQSRRAADRRGPETARERAAHSSRR